MPMRIAMIEITTSSSTRVNALFFMGISSRINGLWECDESEIDTFLSEILKRT
jgi:hypothetical protein